MGEKTACLEEQQKQQQQEPLGGSEGSEKLSTFPKVIQLASRDAV